MRRIKMNLADYIEVLQMLQDQGVNDVIIFEQGGFPALTDADDPTTCIIFANEGDEVPGEDGELH